jgi:hypothetical protein
LSGLWDVTPICYELKLDYFIARECREYPIVCSLWLSWSL